MSQDTGAAEAEEFARLLRELKTRSGLSYGTLAKRLHMSTSTLHRYCSGTALPNEYMAAERFARLCRATPDELVELHRSWILADAARGRRTDRVAEPASAQVQAQPSEPASEPVPTPAPVAPQQADRAEPAEPGELPPGEAGGEPVIELLAQPGSPRRRRNVLIASAAAVALLAAVVVVVRPGVWGGDNGSGDRQAAGATASGAQATGTSATGTTALQEPLPSVTGSSAGNASSADTASAAATPRATAATSPTTTPSAAQPTDGPAPLTIGTRPYVYADQCSQHFLVNSAPAQVGPPAPERDAPRWAAAYGAVSSGEQQIAFTVQGTGADTVVLEALHVRIAAKGAPLAWNDYSMGVGCGGDVETKSFDIDLDRGSPTVTVKGGQRNFPYKVNESDPEVFYVTAHTKAHDVRWDLTLDWSSGSRHGTVRIDNSGTAFRTSADVNRPGYDYPLGYNEWIKRADG
ncbi:helix-turn-helix transcriptional regulator [Kitasatospora sp. NPDC097691]|uniref:helix-turn-helix domain-containing protein n=1 Tax=Kitasatospora sp. NPDC097691 TaxID=3157231 RepID=UPI00331DD4BF